MWQQSKQRVIKGNKEAVWKLWSDVQNWDRWDNDVEHATLEGGFKTGSTIMFKIKNGPKIKMSLVEVIDKAKYTDLTKFPLAKMYGEHLMEEVPGGLMLTTTITVKGPLRWLWKKLVAEDVVKEIPFQFDNIERLINER